MLGIFTRHTHAQQHTDKREVASTTLSATRSLGRWPPSCAAPERRRLAAAARHAAPLSSRVCGAHRPTPTHTATQRAVHTPRACRLLRQTDGWGRPCSRDRPRALGPRLPTARAALVPVAEETPGAVVAYSQPFLTRSGRLHPTVVGLRAESTFCLPFASAKALGRRSPRPIAAVVPGGESEDQRATARGEARREAGRVALRPHRVPLCPSSTSKGVPSRGQCDEREGCGRPPSRRAGATGRSVGGACREPRRGAVESWGRARRRREAPGRGSTRRLP